MYHEVRSSRPVWSRWWNPVSTNNTKISQEWWHTPVIPATRETEAGESLELGRWKLQWAEIMPLHSSLGDRVTLSQKIKQTKSFLACGVLASLPPHFIYPPPSFLCPVTTPLPFPLLFLFSFSHYVPLALTLSPLILCFTVFESENLKNRSHW